MSKEIMFARSTVSGTKRTARIEARVTDETKADLARRCREAGMTESQFIERLVEVSLYGAKHVLSVERERTAMVCGLSGLFPELVTVHEVKTVIQPVTHEKRKGPGRTVR